MKFGINVSSDDTFGRDPAQRLKDILERVHLARDLGFDSIFSGHRYSIGPAKGPGSLPTSRFMPLLLLARLAPETDNMLIGTSIFLFTLHHPVEIAEEIATLDAICGGRFRFGVGLGWLPYEFEAFGIPKGEKVSRFEESLELIKRLWTEDEVNFEGKHFRFQGVRLNARPLQKPYPPIWIGASVDAAVKRAAKLGDSWAISSHIPLSDLERQVPLYRQTLAELGKPFPKELPCSRIAFIAKDRDTAVKEAVPQLQEWYKKRGQWGWFLMKGGQAETSWQELQAGRWIIGAPDDCIEQISRFERFGVQHMIFSLPGPGASQDRKLESIRLLGEKVLPYFKRSKL